MAAHVRVPRLRQRFTLDLCVCENTYNDKKKIKLAEGIRFSPGVALGRVNESPFVNVKVSLICNIAKDVKFVVRI